MMNKTTAIYFSIACLSLASCRVNSSNIGTTTNCTTGEEILYSCSTGKKTLSYCASKPGAADPFLEYRYGIRNKPELVYRPVRNDRKSYFNRTTLTGASNESTVIWFKRGNFSYILNDPMRGSPFLKIVESGKSIATIECKGNFSGDPEKANPFILRASPEDYFNLTK
ncbi:hypothetical protein HH212_19980 [Massilia forsythiae]|uniref:Lipoprotein n=1 Tax=Massilia forsythiae TaxID=2728020 RepID=A0A7Z2VZ83_9BURK|nr:hypothetical protein [Massilia forsythiae]QJE02016.1 hypothetical protein HH212_19980 [Massilia forsythiae]